MKKTKTIQNPVLHLQKSWEPLLCYQKAFAVLHHQKDEDGKNIGFSIAQALTRDFDLEGAWDDKGIALKIFGKYFFEISFEETEKKPKIEVQLVYCRGSNKRPDEFLRCRICGKRIVLINGMVKQHKSQHIKKEH